MRRRLCPASLAAAAVAWGLGLTASALASDGFSVPEAGARLTAGATAKAAWQLDGPREAAFDEMELVLSLDGGATYPIRLTRDLDPRTRSIAWRVPALPTTRARLALRAGGEEEPEEEQILFATEEFAIELDASSPLEPSSPGRGELRIGEAREGRLDPPDSGRVSGAAPSLRAAGEAVAAIAPKSQALPFEPGPLATSLPAGPSGPQRSPLGSPPRTAPDPPRRE